MPGEQYLIGLLSAFDAILQIPTPRILQMLPLRHEAAAALLGSPGPASIPLQLLLCYEKRQWIQCARMCKALAISEAELTSTYLAALQWASKEVRKAGN
jgi:c-di-GMP-related signal transduction protein